MEITLTADTIMDFKIQRCNFFPGFSLLFLIHRTSWYGVEDEQFGIGGGGPLPSGDAGLITAMRSRLQGHEPREHRRRLACWRYARKHLSGLSRHSGYGDGEEQRVLLEEVRKGVKRESEQ
jgi:hypothetical protein